jgi:hypothetical protein
LPPAAQIAAATAAIYVARLHLGASMQFKFKTTHLGCANTTARPVQCFLRPAAAGLENGNSILEQVIGFGDTILNQFAEPLQFLFGERSLRRNPASAWLAKPTSGFDVTPHYKILSFPLQTC